MDCRLIHNHCRPGIIWHTTVVKKIDSAPLAPMIPPPLDASLVKLDSSIVQGLVANQYCILYCRNVANYHSHRLLNAYLKLWIQVSDECSPVATLAMLLPHFYYFSGSLLQYNIGQITMTKLHRISVWCNSMFCNLIGMQYHCSRHKTQYKLATRLGSFQAFPPSRF